MAAHFAEDMLAHALRMEDGEIIGGTELARIVKKLTEFEVEEGGPYAFVVGGKADLGVNLAIERFLAACGVQLPKLDAYLGQALKGTPRSRVFDKKALSGLLHWHRTGVSRELDSKHIGFNDEEKKIQERIRAVAKKRFSKLSTELRGSAQMVMERTIEGNPDKQMSLMALYLRQALGSSGKRFSDEHIAELGLANVFFWTAFVIYDDFWDEDEAADPKILPTANLFARHYTDFFSTLLPDNTNFRTFFHQSMDALDGANSWETAMCRAHVENNTFFISEKLPVYGDFGIKFYPAAGHVLGPVAMLIETGHSIDSREVKSLVEYFRHYLVAMQLNDDMHDWKEDIARGHISTAVATILQRWIKKFPRVRTIHLEKDMPALEEIFWFDTLRPLCDAALQHCARSREALQKINSIQNAAPLERYITRNEYTARQALAEYQRSRDFMRGFS